MIADSPVADALTAAVRRGAPSYPSPPQNDQGGTAVCVQYLSLSQ